MQKRFSAGWMTIAALLVASFACSQAENKPGSPGDVAGDTVKAEMVVDTGFPTVMGYAVKQPPGAWCLVTSRSDMWNGKPIMLIQLDTRRQHRGHVRDTLASCAPAESPPGAQTFALEMPDAPADSGVLGVVLRDDVWGNVNRQTHVFKGKLDGVEGDEFVQECAGENRLHLFVTSDSANGRVRWQHTLPLSEAYRAGRPHCDGRLGEARAPAVAAVAAVDAPVRGQILFPTTRSPTPLKLGSDWYAIMRHPTQMEVMEAASLAKVTDPPCPGSLVGHTLDPQISGKWIAMVSGTHQVRSGMSPLPVIIGQGARRLARDSVVVLLQGNPLMVRGQKVGESGFEMYVEVMGARSTLYSTEFLAQGSWQVPLALDYDGDGAADIMTTVTSRSGTESRFFLSTQRPLMGGKWPATAQLVVPSC